jgi:hypothetical protein
MALPGVRPYMADMFRRWILALLIACLAFPAAAAPLNGAPATETVVASSPCHGEAQKHKPAQTAKHQCIGCVPLVAACTHIAAPSGLRGIVGIAAAIRWPGSLADLPAIPPPRS